MSDTLRESCGNAEDDQVSQWLEECRRVISRLVESAPLLSDDKAETLRVLFRNEKTRPLGGSFPVCLRCPGDAESP